MIISPPSLKSSSWIELSYCHDTIKYRALLLINRRIVLCTHEKGKTKSRPKDGFFNISILMTVCQRVSTQRLLLCSDCREFRFTCIKTFNQIINGCLVIWLQAAHQHTLATGANNFTIFLKVEVQGNATAFSFNLNFGFCQLNSRREQIQTLKVELHAFVDHQRANSVNHNVFGFHQRHHDMREVHARELNVALGNLFDKCFVGGNFTFTCYMEVLFVSIINNSEVIEATMLCFQADAITDHACKFEAHFLTDASTGKHDGKQKIPRNAETFVIFIMNGIEIARDFFCKVTRLLTGKAEYTILF
ncbi:hypothetical protein H744_2c2090 [Photobacterium gaetbulicola Gung47]|uniref:Uncharacterized protein n=1 Tax=Photobacterium gaetbulicola Gung47 TaxID=658445 RepID=A0A0C5WUP0_9GAMM|nr:hypothetical protein H744_2c2090 [Photobacterium gaetbulicola Gung47]